MKRKIAILILVLAVLFGGLTLLKLSNRPSLVEGTFGRIAANIKQPELIGKDMYFFTGSAFAKINMVNGQSTALSSYFNSQAEVLVNSWSKDGVIFTTSGASDDDLFGQVLGQKGLKSGDPHWWRYDFAKQSLQLINFEGVSTCVNIVQVDDSLFCFAPINASVHDFAIYKYGLEDGGLSKVQDIGGPIGSVRVQSGLIYFSSANLDTSQTIISYNPSSNRLTNIYASKSRLQFSVNSFSIMVNELPLLNKTPSANRSEDSSEDSTPTKQTLKLLSVQGSVMKSEKVKAAVGRPTSSITNLVSAPSTGNFYVAGVGAITEYETVGDDVASLWTLGNYFYYVDSNNNLYSNKNIPTKMSGDSFDQSLNTAPNKFYVSEESNGQNATYLNDSSQDFNGNASTMAAWLRTKDYDPSQFNFDWQDLSSSGLGSTLSSATILE